MSEFVSLDGVVQAPGGKDEDLVDGFHLLLYPLMLGGGKRIWPDNAHAAFTLRSATPYPTGVLGLDYVRQR